MVNIRFYSSDHGLGHVSRDIAIIKELVKIPGVKVFARNFSGNKLIANSFAKSVYVTPKRNDFGVLNKDSSFETDEEKTYQKLKEWIALWDNFISEEKRFCKGTNIDLVVSDVSPQPFLVADELNIPSVAVSNFTWHCIYSDLFGKSDPLVERIRGCYQLAAKSIVLPFEQIRMCMPSQIKTGLVCRQVEKSKEETRKALGLSADDFVIFATMGFSMEHLPEFRKERLPKNVRIVSSFLPDAIRISETMNFQDVIASSDLVVCKAGYTTVAEAISGKVPIIITARDGFIDDETVCKGVEKLGVGKRISNKSFLSMDYLSDCHEFALRSKAKYSSLPKRFSSLHNEEVAKLILSC